MRPLVGRWNAQKTAQSRLMGKILKQLTFPPKVLHSFTCFFKQATQAGLLTYSSFGAFPLHLATVAYRPGIFVELTVSGKVWDSHPIPFSSFFQRNLRFAGESTRFLGK